MRYAHEKLIIIVLGMVVMACSVCGCSSGGGGVYPVSPASPSLLVTLAAPAAITADPGNQRVTLNWPPVSGATSYNIYYATTPGVTKATGTKVANQNPPFVLRFLPGDVTPLTTARRTISSSPRSTRQGEGPGSREVSAVPSATPPPPAPVQVRAEAQAGGVSLSWNASAAATSYTVYYGTSAGVTKASGTPVPTAASPKTVAPLTSGTAYYFTVTASNANGESTTSFEVSATPSASPPPAVPAGVSAVEGNQQVTVSWNPVAGATTYHLYYCYEYQRDEEQRHQDCERDQYTYVVALADEQAAVFHCRDRRQCEW